MVRGLAFGAYQPLTFVGKLTSVDKTSIASVSLMCTAIVTGGSYTISLGGRTYGLDIGCGAVHPQRGS